MKDARDPLYRRHRFLAEVIAYAVWFALLHRPPARTRRRPLAYFYLGVLDVDKYLRQIPHLEIRPTDRVIAVMVGFGFGDAVEVDASVAGSQILPDDLKVRMASEAIAAAMRFGQLLDFLEHPDEGDTQADDDAQKQQLESRGCEHGEHRSCNVNGVPTGGIKGRGCKGRAATCSSLPFFYCLASGRWRADRGRALACQSRDTRTHLIFPKHARISSTKSFGCSWAAK